MNRYRTKPLICLSAETKETDRAIGRSMAALVVAERHLWLTLSDIKVCDRVFLLDAPLSPSGLFGDAVGAVISQAPGGREAGGGVPAVSSLIAL